MTTVVMMAFFLLDIIGWIALGPYPSSAEGWFELLQENRLVGFLPLSFLTFLPEEIGAILLMIGGLPRLIRLILVGRRFFQLGQGKTGALSA